MRSLRAADVGPSSDASSTLLDSSTGTLYHGTRAGVLCLILRDGLRSSPKSHGVKGLWLTEDVQWGFHWGRTPLDEFPGCVIEVEVESVRRNRRIPRSASQDWVAFVKDLRTAIWEVASSFPWQSQRAASEEFLPHRIDYESVFLFPSCHKCLVEGASREVSCMHTSLEPFVIEFSYDHSKLQGSLNSESILNLCSGLYYLSPCRSCLSTNLGRTFESCAMMNLLARTPRPGKPCRIQRCAAATMWNTMLWEKRRPCCE